MVQPVIARPDGTGGKLLNIHRFSGDAIAKVGKPTDDEGSVHDPSRP
jgi:hypothetical protein